MGGSGRSGRGRSREGKPGRQIDKCEDRSNLLCFVSIRTNVPAMVFRALLLCYKVGTSVLFRFIVNRKPQCGNIDFLVKAIPQLDHSFSSPKSDSSVT